MAETHVKITFCRHMGLGTFIEMDPCSFGIGLITPNA